MSDLKDENSDEENADEKTCPEEEEFNSSVNGIGDASENLGGVDAESVVNSEVGDVMSNGNGESSSNIPTKLNLEESDNDKNLSNDGDKVSGLENNEKMKSETTSDDDDDDDDDMNEQEEVLSPEEQNNATSEVDNAYDSDEEPSLSIKEEEEPPLNEDTQANNIKSAELNSSNDLAESNVSQGEANNNNNNNHNNNNNSSSDKSTPVLDALPECRNKRSYICGYCNMKTNNPREYLYHLKDTHGESIKIFECSLCIYASKTHQKLVRHNHMVHKINIAPESSDHKKKSKEKDFKPSGNKKLKSSPMNRSPRESKSPRRFQEYEFMNDSEAELEESYATTKTSSSSGKPLYNCDQCSFSTFSTKVLAKHEIKFHLKRKFFKCTRCSYATQVKARYTKHMKYHQLPIIKCDWCDFRTPYRWNLDRHNKNHTEEIGEHKCHLCNFSAQIKQSLTVHIANHHLTPEQIKERESKRIIGVCDPEDFLEDEEMELLRMERDEDPDALELPESSVMASNQSFTVSNIDMGNQDDFESSVNGNEDSENLDEPKRKKPKIKITLKKMKPSKDTFPQEVNERHNFNEDFIHPDDVVQRHGNVYIKSEKCSLCSFKAPFLKEVQKHKRKVHGIHSIKTDDTKKNNKSSRSDKLSDSSENSSDSSSESAKRKYHEIADYASDKSDNFEYNEEFPIDNSEALNDQQIKSGEEEEEDEDEEEEEEPSSKDSTPAKKKSSFFDKLQEKLSTSNVQNLVCQFCGHESKCLSESVRHQKLHLSVKNVYATPSLSTRCQFCRHRCKTTDDLMNHLKSCPEARKNQISDNMTGDINDDFAEEEKISPSAPDTAENQRPREGSRKLVKKRVYRCPQCKYWAATASRFHVHIMGHYNAKPHRCSECSYRSNWRWDVSKHIKLKMLKDPAHQHAKMRLIDDIGDSCEKYEEFITEVRMNEKLASRNEGGTSSLRKARPKSKFETDSTETDSSKSSPCPTPLTISSANTSTITPSTGHSANIIPAPPKLMRAPNHHFTSSPGPNPFGPINPGAQMMVEMGSANNPSDGDLNKKKFPMKPPPLVAMGTLAHQQQQFMPRLQQHQQQQQQLLQHPDLPLPSSLTSSGNEDESSLTLPQNSRDDANHYGSNYQIITPQNAKACGALQTSLETLQLLAAGSTNLAKLKQQQKETGEGNNPELDAAVANQSPKIC
ncbi:RE1-silencing transcription factor [Armadillidium nasatum]|uniref:RE1-silencing transcription factor n=1 Tax=Armadillidium nasatum TaxID=96803 RepID=A0A5N5T2Y7_9CRUS|nr:RE1-silencing transcription factor [Armadillidium nasatum]